MQIQLDTTGMERPKMAQSIGHTYTLASRNFDWRSKVKLMFTHIIRLCSVNTKHRKCSEQTQ